MCFDPSSLFETTIRHVGGLLSAYELSGKNNITLVQKAEQVARELAYAFTDVSTCWYYVSGIFDLNAMHRKALSLTVMWTFLIKLP